MANVQIFQEQKNLTEAIVSFLMNLPSDTKSVQVGIYAYTDDYDNYTDATKCVKEADIWWNLSKEAQMELLSVSVTEAIKATTEFVSLPRDTSEDMTLIKAAEEELETTYKQLARSFSITFSAEDNIETQALAEEQLEKLFKAIVAFENQELFQLAIQPFNKKKSLAEQMQKLQWTLMCSSKKPVASKPKIGKPNIPPVKQPIATPATNTSPGDTLK